MCRSQIPVLHQFARITDSAPGEVALLATLQSFCPETAFLWEGWGTVMARSKKLLGV